MKARLLLLLLEVMKIHNIEMGDRSLATKAWFGDTVDPFFTLTFIPYNKHSAFGYLVKRHIVSQCVDNAVNLSVKINGVFILPKLFLERMTLHPINTNKQELVLVDESRFYSAGPDGFLGFNVFAKKFQIPDSVFFKKFHNGFLSRDGKITEADVAGVPDNTSGAVSFSTHLPDRMKLLVSCCRILDSALDDSNS